MANLPESATYDAGVYQLELTDPVQGGPTGVSNTPLKNLANRTAWLKSQIDGIKGGTVDLALYARLASPTFTGSPSAPTAALGDNTTKLATTGFVQKTLGGFLSKSIAGTGSVTLTAVEAGNGIIMFTGALTGNRDVIVPSSPTRPWIIRNATTGAFSVTVKTAAGTGVVVAQGQNAAVFCDGTNVLAGESWAAPLASPVLTGNPTAPTPAQFDDDTSIATTAFVKRALGSVSGVLAIDTTSLTGTNAHVGQLIYAFGSGGSSFSLPNTAPPGAIINLANISGLPFRIVSQAGQTLMKRTGAAYAGNLFDIPTGATCAAICVGSSTWLIVGDANNHESALFSSSLNTTGYQKLPSGLIIQWGVTALPPGTDVRTSLPVAFPSFFTSIVAMSNYTIGSGVMNSFIVGTPAGTTSHILRASVYTDAFWLAIGF